MYTPPEFSQSLISPPLFTLSYMLIQLMVCSMLQVLLYSVSGLPDKIRICVFYENKMANYNDGVCEDLETFSNIRYTPAWYYKKWPGFLNVESYKILAAWDQGVRTEEGWLRDEGMEEEKGG